MPNFVISIEIFFKRNIIKYNYYVANSSIIFIIIKIKIYGKVAITQTKPLHLSMKTIESINEVDHNANLQRNLLESKELGENSALSTNETSIKATTQIDATNSAADIIIDTTVRPVSVTLLIKIYN